MGCRARSVGSARRPSVVPARERRGLVPCFPLEMKKQSLCVEMEPTTSSEHSLAGLASHGTPAPFWMPSCVWSRGYILAKRVKPVHVLRRYTVALASVLLELSVVDDGGSG